MKQELIKTLISLWFEYLEASRAERTHPMFSMKPGEDEPKVAVFKGDFDGFMRHLIKKEELSKLGCAHGRGPGVPCPWCSGINQ